MEDGSWEKLVVMLTLGGLPWVFVFVGGFLVWRARAFTARAIRLTGTVIGVHQSSSYNHNTNSHSTTYKPVFSFTLPDGREAQGKTFLSGSGRNFAPGTQKEILVDPENPETVRLPGFMLYGFGAIFAVAGLIFGVVSLFALSTI